MEIVYDQSVRVQGRYDERRIRFKAYNIHVVYRVGRKRRGPKFLNSNSALPVCARKKLNIIWLEYIETSLNLVTKTKMLYCLIILYLTPRGGDAYFFERENSESVACKWSIWKRCLFSGATRILNSKIDILFESTVISSFLDTALLFFIVFCFHTLLMWNFGEQGLPLEWFKPYIVNAFHRVRLNLERRTSRTL